MSGPLDKAFGAAERFTIRGLRWPGATQLSHQQPSTTCFALDVAGIPRLHGNEPAHFARQYQQFIPTPPTLGRMKVNAPERITNASELSCAEIHEELAFVDQHGWSLVPPVCSSHAHTSAHRSNGGSPGKKRAAVGLAIDLSPLPCTTAAEVTCPRQFASRS